MDSGARWRGVRDVSLRECFAEAHVIRALAGEVATQDAAILRLLLAILHRSVADLPEYAVDVWRGLWAAPTLPLVAIDQYLDRVEGRFNLFDDVAPFLQVADLSAAKTSGLVKLVADVPDGAPFFTTRAGVELESLSLSEAARWLVHVQAFDPSGIKTGMQGDPRVKGGKGYPIGTGWVGRCGLIIAEGVTLKDTLLLNLVLGTGESDAEPDLPVWERKPLGPGPEHRHPEPLGPIDLLTWPARRVRLVRSPDQPGRVIDVLLGNGDRLEVANRHRLEFMSGWRRSRNQEKTHGVPTYMPRGHDPSRRLWRGWPGSLRKMRAQVRFATSQQQHGHRRSSNGCLNWPAMGCRPTCPSPCTPSASVMALRTPASTPHTTTNSPSPSPSRVIRPSDRP